MTERAPIVRDDSPVTRTFRRFELGQRWEHGLLMLTFTALLLTGLPQKYRAAAWSQYILSTPDRVYLLQTIHRISAVVLMLEACYHVARGVFFLARRQLSGAIFPTLQDLRDAVQMLRYLLFLTDREPKAGKYNFEQKFTYWFFFFGIAILGTSGLLIWFPEFFTRFLPGGIIPAAKLAHSTEAVVAAIFLILWHFYHVHIKRLNLSMFTGYLKEQELRDHHTLEYERRIEEMSEASPPGGAE